ncbi:cyclic nucleotide-binding domain-containing protein [Loktanella sp. M215]|nr:cyclic nucleotide-binding domain-containing thioredoxin-disulfide reductase [Loktanella sp. M215]MCF7702421.1 cyclic nucleotide-binding domain-containing protein [Loktanella sp. M215]
MESLAINLANEPRVPLDESHLDAIRAIGVERCYATGDMVVRPGDPMIEFMLVEDGDVILLDSQTGGQSTPGSLKAGQYLGEIAFLNGGVWSMGMRAAVDTRVVVVPREDMLALMARVPELSDRIVTVFAGRRRRIFENDESALTLIGADQSRDLRRLESFAARNRIAVKRLELGSDEACRLLGEAECALDIPTALFAGKQLTDITPRAVARLLGLDMPLTGEGLFDVAIVGGGPAGIAAAVYAGAEGLRGIVIENEVIGGQAGSSSRIENYMGFPTGISGGDLAWRGEIQAMRLGTRFVMPRSVTGIARGPDETWDLTLDDGETIQTKTVVVATGVQYRRLPIARLEDFEGAGVYYAATDMEARFCRDRHVAIVGGGNSAGQAAMFLARVTAHVHVLIRKDNLHETMSAYLSSRLEHEPAITIHPYTEVAALDGETTLDSCRLRDTRDGTERHIDLGGLFVMIGAAPNTGWLEGVIDLNDKGFVLTGPAVGAATPFGTSAPGIFGVGDVRLGSVKRVASGVGEGSVVISDVWNYVNKTLQP